MIKVLSAGFLTTVQDLGRKGYANSGIPVSGAMDNYSATLANAILDNDNNSAVLEITFGNCKLEFQKNTYICISGADFTAQLNTNPIQLNTIIKVLEGDVLSFGKQIFGVRTYVAVLGGFQTKTVLNSKSFYKGITNISVVKKGDLLPFNVLTAVLKPSLSAVKQNKKHFNSKTITCFKGPEFDLLSAVQQKQLLQTTFNISDKNSRMAYQLNPLIANDLKSMLTSAVFPGTVQLTPSGQLIVLMRDCQVTGGYPRVLVLTHDAINQLAQKITRNTFTFRLLNF